MVTDFFTRFIAIPQPVVTDFTHHMRQIEGMYFATRYW